MSILDSLTVEDDKPTCRDLAVFFMVPLLVEGASIPAVKAILTIQVL